MVGWGNNIHPFAKQKWSNPFALNSEYSRTIEYFMLVHYLTKYLDFGDTIFMILKQNFRQLSFLHIFHHSSILVVWGYLLQTGHANGTAYFGAAINSFVHTIMYSHYLWTTLGLNNPFKRMVTQIQMVQFFLCLLHAVMVVVLERVLPSYLAYLQLSYHCIMIYLFMDFQRRTYTESKKRTK